MWCEKKSSPFNTLLSQCLRSQHIYLFLFTYGALYFSHHILLFFRFNLQFEPLPGIATKERMNERKGKKNNKCSKLLILLLTPDLSRTKAATKRKPTNPLNSCLIYVPNFLFIAIKKKLRFEYPTQNVTTSQKHQKIKVRTESSKQAT